MNKTTIEIDGAQGEGGGQVLRTALALSMVMQRPLVITRIRAGRRNPGLAPQHLAGLLAAAEICQAELEGASLASTEVRFSPRAAARAGRYRFDVAALSGRGSAGAVTLILQTLLLPLAIAQGHSHLTLLGGTHVNWSPPVYYAEQVLLPLLGAMGLKAHISLESWGWYPQGGGQLEVTIEGGTRLRGLDMTERGELREIRGLAAVSNLPSHIPQRIAARANNRLRAFDLPAAVEPLRLGGPSTGAGIFIALEYEGARAGFSALGEQGKPSEVVADEAIDALIGYVRSEAALDQYLPDQLLPFLALAEGPSRITTECISGHTETAAEVIRAFLERDIRLAQDESGAGLVEVL